MGLTARLQAERETGAALLVYEVELRIKGNTADTMTVAMNITVEQFTSVFTSGPSFRVSQLKISDSRQDFTQ